MPDPLSAGSTAVGAVSLGLQVCEILYRYYDAWKSYDEDIASTAASIRNLSRILTTLNQMISQNLIPQTQKQVVEDSLLACQGSLQKLEKVTKKIGREPLTNDVRNCLENARRRLVYPIKQSTLAKIRENVSESEAALDTAMSVLQTSVIWRIVWERTLTRCQIGIFYWIQSNSWLSYLGNLIPFCPRSMGT